MISTVVGIGSAEATDTPPIPAHESTYRVLHNGRAIGEATFVLEKANASVWHLTTETIPTSMLAKLASLSVTEASHFVWQDHQASPRVLPLTYHNVSKEPFRTRYWQHRYDWETLTSATTTHDGEQTIELSPGLLDPLTLRLQLAADLQNGDARQQDRAYVVLDRDDVEDQRMEYQGRARIEVPAGCFDTEHFYRFRKEGSARNYDLWVAGELHWLPVKIIQSDGRRSIEMALEDSSLLDDAARCPD